jgi:hypothetical protein
MANVRDVEPYAIEIAELCDHLGLVFHRFLTGNARGRSTVEITVNGTPVIPNNPVEHPLVKPFNPTPIEIQRGMDTPAKIELQAFVLPNEEELKQHHAPDGDLAVKAAMKRLSLGDRMNANQGFYFYRLDRLIKWGGWCGVYAEDEHTKLLRVTVDFDRRADDLMKVNIAKKEVQLSVKLKEEFKNLMKTGRAEARTRYDKKPATPRPPSGGPGATPGPRVKPPKGGPSGGPAGGPEPPVPTPVPTPVPKPAAQVQFRVVTMDKRWQLSKGFLGETKVQVSEKITPLATLVRDIDTNADAKVALAEFLAYLDLNPNA